MANTRYWMGVPLSSLSRDALELAFINLNEELIRVQQQSAEQSAQPIRYLADLAATRGH